MREMTNFDYFIAIVPVSIVFFIGSLIIYKKFGTLPEDEK